ncbi:hypothetical protein diail_826 [Diaporthe ilicicola]|nr:hypothetical protein diail_826 [Diaporthe ilicicola]
MYESTPRSREVANALFQIDKLTEDQARAVLRHIAIDDAVLNDAQCSHVAGLITGTLYKVPREGVNAMRTCETGLSAAVSWEKSFASHPGHVSATFHDPINDKEQVGQSPQQTASPEKDTAAVPETTDPTCDTDVCPDNLLGMKGLSITNTGKLTLHYHSYPATSIDHSQPTTVPRKRGLQEIEDEQHSEALASPGHCDNPPALAPQPEPHAKRLKLKVKKMKDKKVKIEPGKSKQDDDQDVAQNDQPADKEAEKQKKSRRCVRCGEAYKGSDNDGANTPCCYHPGNIKKYPHGLSKWSGNMRELLFVAWDCCHQDADSRGCTFEKHTKRLSP